MDVPSSLLVKAVLVDENRLFSVIDVSDFVDPILLDTKILLDSTICKTFLATSNLGAQKLEKMFAPKHFHFISLSDLKD